MWLELNEVLFKMGREEEMGVFREREEGFYVQERP